MARRKKLSPGTRGGSTGRKMKITATIYRHPSTAGEYSDGYAFEACLRLKGKGGGSNCGYGKNPRKALANALSATAKRLKKRTGAFRGMR